MIRPRKARSFESPFIRFVTNVAFIFFLVFVFLNLHDAGIDVFVYLPSTANLILMTVFGFLLPFIHEPGHMIAAALIGWETNRIEFGAGRPLFRRRVSGVLVVVRAIPLGGFTFLGETRSGISRLKCLAYFAGGLAIQLFAAFTVIFAFGLDLTNFFGNPEIDIAAAFVAANFLSIIFNLIPRNINTGFIKIPNDGMHIFGIRSLKEKEIHQLEASNMIMSAQELLEEKCYKEAGERFAEVMLRFPDIEAAWINYSVTRIRLMRLDEAEQVCTRVLEREHDAQYDALIHNNLAWIDLLRLDPASLEKAKAAIDRACALNPYAGKLGTKGCILIACGEFDEGIASLKPIAKRYFSVNDPVNHAINLLFLAFAYRKKGERGAAAPLVKKAARSIDRLDADNAVLFRHLCALSDNFDGSFNLQ